MLRWRPSRPPSAGYSGLHGNSCLFSWGEVYPRVKKITAELCGNDLSKSTVSQLAKKLDEQVEAWAERPLGSVDEDQTRYPFVFADAMHLKVRRQGAVRLTTVPIAIGINREGHRRSPGP